MNRKINLLTLMIIAYSIIICATFKKDELSNSFSTVKSNSQPTKTQIVKPVSNDKITASVSPVVNVNQ